ncbi:hypothetical protein PHYPSEUDO_010702 [Phytophthora pseudosyringae]|uniref:Transmembrane protein n=1 Tax=Phytophthora pseudosyringae TaxID=221518 RepID=A0A8T1V9M3_9STRA|nr:hypothetical protein PHYPSEUDO_010702 [Phytophthora pseudosyringae]
MALHRKQRGVVDTGPQFVRIPTSGGRAVGFSLHETHPRAQRVYAKRYAAGDRSRNKISSLQLRACFVLCVLLYFGAIYFADDIASIGRVVGSEQNSQNFFVHSLRPRGGGNMRVGRAVDAKKAEVTTVPALTTAALDGADQQQLEQDDPPTEEPALETESPRAEVATAEMEEEARATEPLGAQVGQPETEAVAKAIRQDEKKALDDAPGDAVHPDDQGEGIPADQTADAEPTHPAVDKPIEQAALISGQLVESNDEHHEARGREQEDPIASAFPQNAITARDQPHPTAPGRHPEKEGNADAVPAASPSRIKEKQHIHGNVDRKPEHPERQANRNQKLSEEIKLVDELQGGAHHLTEMTEDKQQEGGEQYQPAETTTPAATSALAKAEHISNI